MSKGYTKPSIIVKQRKTFVNEKVTDSDIFALKDGEKLPEDVAKELGVKPRESITQKLIDFFDVKNELTIDEIIIAFWKKHQIKRTRKWVHVTLYGLKDKIVRDKVKCVWRKL